jgi:hypothetical protein
VNWEQGCIIRCYRLHEVSILSCKTREFVISGSIKAQGPQPDKSGIDRVNRVEHASDKLVS